MRYGSILFKACHFLPLSYYHHSIIAIFSCTVSPSYSQQVLERK